MALMTLADKRVKNLRTIFKTPRFEVLQGKFEGNEHYRTVPNYRYGASALVVRRDGKLLMVKMHRPFFHHPTYEFVGGGSDSGEGARAAIKREIVEETGYTPYKITKVMGSTLLPSMAVSNHAWYIAYVENKPDQVPVGDQSDSSVKILTVAQAERLLKKGHFTYTSSIGLLLYYLRYVRKA